MRRVARRLITALTGTAPPPPPELPAPAVATPEAVARARLALADAAAQMPTLLHDDQDPSSPELAAVQLAAAEYAPSEAAALRQALRAYTDQIDRMLTGADDERWALRAQVAQLTAEVMALRAEMVSMRAALPPVQTALASPDPDGPAAAGERSDAPLPQVADAAEDEQPGDRRLAPGGEGVLLMIRPPQRPASVERLCRALEADPDIERALPAASTASGTGLRLRLRAPSTVTGLTSAFERALGLSLDGDAFADHGDLLELRLRVAASRRSQDEG